MAAKIYRVPEELGTCEFSGSEDYREYAKREKAWVEKVRQWARDQFPKDALAGELYHFPVADGAAQYVVLRGKPLELLWLEIGDAWQMPDVVRRGLSVDDIRQDARRAKAIAELIERKKS